MRSIESYAKAPADPSFGLRAAALILGELVPSQLDHAQHGRRVQLVRPTRDLGSIGGVLGGDGTFVFGARRDPTEALGSCGVDWRVLTGALGALNRASAQVGYVAVRGVLGFPRSGALRFALTSSSAPAARPTREFGVVGAAAAVCVGGWCCIPGSMVLEAFGGRTIRFGSSTCFLVRAGMLGSR